jgi:protease-4
MMKRFLLIVCGSFVGAFLAFMLFMIVGIVMSFGIMGSMSMGGGKKGNISVSKHSILKLDLGMNISERDDSEPLDMMSLLQNQGLPTSTGLNTLVAAIENAATNDKVDGIYIECNGVSAAPATLEKLRSALKQFKKSGKWIAAYGY